MILIYGLIAMVLILACILIFGLLVNMFFSRNDKKNAGDYTYDDFKDRKRIERLEKLN